MNSCLLGTRAPSTFMSKGPGKFFLYIGWALPDELKPSSQLTSPQACDIG